MLSHRMTDLASTARRARPISLTALIDVVFILLMFFMLTSSFTQWHVLPLISQASTDTAKSEEAPQLLVLHETGDVTLNTATNSSTRYPHLAEALVEIQWQKAIVVLPEPQIPVQHLVDALTTLKSQGASTVSIGETLDKEAR